MWGVKKKKQKKNQKKNNNNNNNNYNFAAKGGEKKLLYPNFHAPLKIKWCAPKVVGVLKNTIHINM